MIFEPEVRAQRAHGRNSSAIRFPEAATRERNFINYQRKPMKLIKKTIYLRHRAQIKEVREIKIK